MAPDWHSSGSIPDGVLRLASLTAKENDDSVTMVESHRTPYANDALKVENGTEPEEIHDFLRGRVSNPREVRGLTVWNFNNHILNLPALEEQAGDFLYDEYLIPFQAPSVWGYMVTLLPERIREAEILTYSQHDGEYNPYPNFFRHTDRGVNDGVRQELEDLVRQGDVQ